MKKYLLLLLLPFLMSCEKENFSNNNPYLPNYGFSVNINMNLPQFSNLQFPSNAVYINKALSSCSTMTLSGINAICACDGASYSLFTGQATGMQYPMKQYRVEQLDAVSLRVYN